MTRFIYSIFLGLISLVGMGLAPYSTVAQSTFHGTVTYQWVSYESEMGAKAMMDPS